MCVFRLGATAGVRHMSLIALHLLVLYVLCWLLLALLGWRTRSAHSLSALLAVLPLFAAALSLLSKLVARTGGTFASYAAIFPLLSSSYDVRSVLSL